MSLLELFCRVDDFWKSFAPGWHQRLASDRNPQTPAAWASERE